MNMLNLDKLAAERAQAIVKKVRAKAEEEAAERGQRENKPPDQIERDKKAQREKRTETLERLATKTLGVLQEQGVYAMLLFLFSRTSDEEKVAPTIRGELFNALKELPGFKNKSEVQSLQENTDAQTALGVYSEKVLDEKSSPGGLDTLLLVRDLYEQTLIYTRFGAKAAKAAAETEARAESAGAEV